MTCSQSTQGHNCDQMVRVLLIDNYDSFTYNVFQYMSQIAGVDVIVHRNDQIKLKQCQALKPDYLVISPGPGGPLDSGVSLEAIDYFKDKIPVLGVCLGHQAIFHLFGGTVDVCDEIMHGKTSPIQHDEKGVFAGMKQGFLATRYHSLVGIESTLPQSLEVSARTEKGLIMGVRHKQFNVRLGLSSCLDLSRLKESSSTLNRLLLNKEW